MRILERLRTKGPDQHIGYTAIQELDNIDDIRQFYKGYILWCREDHTPSEATRIANETMGWLFGELGGDREIYELWKQALAHISHPILGETHSPENSIRKGRELAGE